MVPLQNFEGMRFEVGQDVVCIHDNWVDSDGDSIDFVGPKKGVVYTIVEICNDPRGFCMLVFDEFPDCEWYYGSFRPLDNRAIELVEEAAEIINEPEVVELA